MPTNDLKITLVDVNKIIPYWRNPRRNDKTVDWLCMVIPQYGFNVPIVLDKQNVIVKGHARLKAAKRLGIEKVPCIYSENDDEANKADRIADNKIQEMSFWDIAKLEMEYQRIGDLKFDKLFHPEEVDHLGFDPEASITFQGVGLNDYGEYYGDEDYSESQESSSEAFDSQEGELQEGDTSEQSETGSGENESILPRGGKALKTICPYCGATVYIRM